MQQQPDGKSIAILVENGFEQVELTQPKHALEQAGIRTQIVSPQKDKVKGWDFTDWGDTFAVDVPLERANPDHYDGLLLPGGVMNPDYLRVNKQALRFVQAFFAANKPVAAICHGPWILIDAGVVNGRTLTSYASIRTDLQNAGARWVDEEVVQDHNLITSRKPDDLPAFNVKLIEMLATNVQADYDGKQLSTAPNASWETGAGEGSTGHDSPEKTTYAHRNSEVRDSLPTDPYPPQQDRSVDDTPLIDKRKFEKRW